MGCTASTGVAEAAKQKKAQPNIHDVAQMAAECAPLPTKYSGTLLAGSPQTKKGAAIPSAAAQASPTKGNIRKGTRQQKGDAPSGPRSDKRRVTWGESEVALYRVQLSRSASF
uniref:Uncharacterized protein n=1 Tax=Strombidinopsis acuminata TaxID=141414 RepID=A0A7S3WIS1_9SPIT|mmetsp:Transcript_101138/g.261378  ORF Transcript_101138/g.261378 Transcript_101138/m.261378 type:complete len:113 (+) Transcript_101138:66-404(+)